MFDTATITLGKEKRLCLRLPTRAVLRGVISQDIRIGCFFTRHTLYSFYEPKEVLKELDTKLNQWLWWQQEVEGISFCLEHMYQFHLVETLTEVRPVKHFLKHQKLTFRDVWNRLQETNSEMFLVSPLRTNSEARPHCAAQSLLKQSTLVHCMDLVAVRFLCWGWKVRSCASGTGPHKMLHQMNY